MIKRYYHQYKTDVSQCLKDAHEERVFEATCEMLFVEKK